MPAMTKEQLEHFEHFGFVTAEGVLDPEEIIDPVIEEYAGVLDNLADELYEDGKISSKYEDVEFGERVTQIYAESDDDIQRVLRLLIAARRYHRRHAVLGWTGGV